MKNSMKQFAFAALATVALAAVVAYASDFEGCLAKIDLLTEQTNVVGLSGKHADADRANLLVKLTEARAKLNEAKFCDSIMKLNDFKAKVNQLTNAAKSKINTDPTGGAVTAQQLIEGADAAIGCINNLATGAGTTCDLTATSTF